MRTDYHIHCLPEMDDGASDTETGLQMLQAIKAQGLERVVATSHFYAHRESPEAFLLRRERAYRALTAQAQVLPIILGAEVRLEKWLSALESLPDLRMGHSEYILLELPYAPFKAWMEEEIYNIAYSHRLKPMLAHLDRYLDGYRKNEMATLLEIEGVVIQIDNDALFKKKTQRFALELIRSGYPVVFGSDAHDMGIYAPNADRMIKILEGKLEKKEWQALWALNEGLLNEGL